MRNKQTAVILAGILLCAAGIMMAYILTSPDPAEVLFVQEVSRQATQNSTSIKGKVYANLAYQYSETEMIDLTEFGPVLRKLFISPGRAGADSAPLPVLCSLWFTDQSGNTHQIDVFGYGNGSLVFGRRGLASFFCRQAPCHPVALDKYCDESTTLCNLIVAVANHDKVAGDRYLNTIRVSEGEAGVTSIRADGSK